MAAWAAEAVPATTAADVTGSPEVELTSVVLQALFPFPEMARPEVASGVEQWMLDDVEDEFAPAAKSCEQASWKNIQIRVIRYW